MVRTRQQPLGKQETGLPFTPLQVLPTAQAKPRSKIGDNEEAVVVEANFNSQFDSSSTTNQPTVTEEKQNYVLLQVLEKPSKKEIAQALEGNSAMVMRKADFVDLIKPRAIVQAKSTTETYTKPPNSAHITTIASESSTLVAGSDSITAATSKAFMPASASKVVGPLASNSDTIFIPEQSSNPSRKNKATEQLERSASTSKRRRVERASSEPEEPSGGETYKLGKIAEAPRPDPRETSSRYAKLHGWMYDEYGNLNLKAVKPHSDEADSKLLPLQRGLVSIQGRVRAIRRRSGDDDFEDLPLDPKPVSLQGRLRFHRDRRLGTKATENIYENTDSVADTGLVTNSTTQGDPPAIPESPAAAETPSTFWRLTGALRSMTKFVPRLRRQLPTTNETSSRPSIKPGKGISRPARVPSMIFAQRKALKEEREIERRVQERLKAHEAAEQVKSGQKRKKSSPTTIPNPKGCSYGMDLDYFGDSSSSDEAETDAYRDSPFLRATKRPCISIDAPSIPHEDFLGDPHHARPYMGEMFAEHKLNIFREAGCMPASSFKLPGAVPDKHEPAAPPPCPTVSHTTSSAADPHQTLPFANTAALEHARSQALEYTGKPSSSPKKASRVSFSPIALVAGDTSIPPTTTSTKPAADTAAAPSHITTQTPFGNKRRKRITKTKVKNTMIVGKDQLTDFEHRCPSGQNVTSDSKILAFLDTTYTPAELERSRRIIAADRALFIGLNTAAEARYTD